MRKSVLAFLGFAFVVYWFATKDLPTTEKIGMQSATPSLVSMLTSRSPFHFATRTVAATSAVTSREPIKKWLQHEALKVGQVDEDSAATLRHLKRKAARLHGHELETLGTIALDTSISADERFLAVYMLGLSETKTAVENLKHIGLAKIPETRNDRQYSDEVVIRAHAVAAAVKNQPPRQAIVYLKKVLAKTPNATISEQAHTLMQRLIR